jgi:hypothetical protein
MEQIDLSEKDLHILDIILNFEPLLEYQLSGFWLSKDKMLNSDEMECSLNKLQTLQLISITKDTYDRKELLINSHSKTKVLNLLNRFWETKAVTEEKLIDIVRTEDNSIMRILELKTTFENKTHLSFSDYYWDSSSHDFCLKLLDINMAFKATWSSKKHNYEEYYLRKFPVDVEKTLHEHILSKADIESLKLDPYWHILLLPIYSESPVTIDDIKENFPQLTPDEIDEILDMLYKKGTLTSDINEVRLSKATRDIIKANFLLKIYQDFKSSTIQQLKERISERVSNLYLLGLLKKLLAASKPKYDGPFCVIKKSSLKGIGETELREARKLGIVFQTKNELILAHEVLQELEKLIKSAISKKIIRIPAKDEFAARIIWKKIFSEECTEYIKIQDEYVNEQTLLIIQSYCPQKIEIDILTSIEGARDMDVDEMKQRMDAIKNHGGKLNLMFIGDSAGKAPFHYRYIISKYACYCITTSIKQVGKSKDADIIPISKEEKDGIIEPAFDYWFSAQLDKLKEKGVNRMAFEEWIECRHKGQGKNK